MDESIIQVNDNKRVMGYKLPVVIQSTDQPNQHSNNLYTKTGIHSIHSHNLQSPVYNPSFIHLFEQSLTYLPSFLSLFLLMLTISLFICSSPDSTPNIPHFQLSLQSNKSLKQVGMFLYHDEKINFNDFVFCNRPFRKEEDMGRGERTIQGNERIGEGIKAKGDGQEERKFGQVQRETDGYADDMFVCFDNDEVIEDLKGKLLCEQDLSITNKTYLLAMYSKKQLDTIINSSKINPNQNHTLEEKNPKPRVNVYRDGDRSSNCIVW